MELADIAMVLCGYVGADGGAQVFQSEYEGNYADNMKDGEGKMTYPDGGIYEGHWKFDKRHGDGVYWYPNGDIYSGEWRFGQKHGRASFISKETGAKLVGTFADGKVRARVCV